MSTSEPGRADDPDPGVGSGVGPDYLPEIAEDEATGEVAALYDELRSLLQASKVNLFYRHLATVPPALSLAVDGVSELVSAGLVPVDAEAVTGGLVPDPAQVPARQAWTALGLDAEDLAAAEWLLSTYNRLNLNNLVVTIRLRHPGSSTRAPSPPARRQRRPGSDAPRPAAGHLTAATSTVAKTPARDLALIEDLKRRYGLPPVIVPSLLRDLGAIPSLLPALTIAASTSLAPSAVSQAATRVRERIESYLNADAPSPAAGHHNPDVERTARIFAPTMSTMYVLGTWMEKILTAENLGA